MLGLPLDRPIQGAHAWPPSTAKFRLSALAQYLRYRRVGRHRLRRMQARKLVVRLPARLVRSGTNCRALDLLYVAEQRTPFRNTPLSPASAGLFLATRGRGEVA